MDIVERLSPALKRNLLALPASEGVWMTIAEMRSKGATGTGMTLLCFSFGPRVCERRWTKWGGETGQLRGEGYEYAITKDGIALRAALTPPLPLEGE